MAQGLEPSKRRGLVWRMAASAGLGLLVQAVMIGGDLLQGNAADVRLTLILACVAFFLAALAAPAGGKRVDSAAVAVVFAVGVGLALGLSAFGVAWSDHLQLALFGAAAAGGALTAVGARSLAGAKRVGRWGIASGAGLAAGGLVVATVVIILAIAPWIMEQRAYVIEDRAIAPFRLHRPDGSPLTSQSLRGHVAVLAFWATWCGPCQGELPELDAVARGYGGDARVMFLAVNPLRDGDTPAKALAYLRAHRIGLPAAMDDSPAATTAISGPAQTDQGEGAQSLGLASLPAIYVLDPAGRLVASHHGYDGSEGLRRSLAARIGRLLAAEPNHAPVGKS